MKIFNKSIFLMLAAFLLLNACDSTEDSPVDEGNNDTGDHVLTVDVTGAHTFSYNSDMDELDYYDYVSEEPRRRALTFLTKISDDVTYTFQLQILGSNSKTTYDLSNTDDLHHFAFYINDNSSNYEYSENVSGNVTLTELTDTTMVGTYNITAYSIVDETEFVNLQGTIDYSGTPVYL